MYRTTLRSASRPAIASLRSSTLRAAPRRFASTAPPADKSRSWKSSAARWGLAFGALYYYNTSPVFAEEATSQTIPAPAAFSNDDLQTVDSILDEKRKRFATKTEKPADKKSADSAKASEPQPDAQSAVATDGSPAALEEDAGQQGAFNPETGEINWDCPCLGGMADGPCGEDFKTAFSCFVYSTEEPKGMDCIEKFQGMQECFKKYPEIYGAELADDEDGAPTPDFGDEQPAPAADIQKAPAADAQKTSIKSTQATPLVPAEEAKEETTLNGSRMVQKDATPVDQDKWQHVEKVDVPKKEVEVEPVQAHDATGANAEIKVIEEEQAQKKSANKQ
ncbi:hypothetical protein FZEAL_2089 [Fusarium zealandicum]|uniref:Mitochondrial intermembrane space import and assembly protein 40 n=1 Tax=Fusarium zealandicum TaxID=1053134 RepID=A0A8H4XP79_9HYPO|nr:hypothetical protein FZEAL_2089 [Fusarium zealandicum]